MQHHSAIRCALIAIPSFWFFITGCQEAAKTEPANQPAGITQSKQTPTGLPLAPTVNQSEIPPELVQKVNDLILSNKEYIALAEKVTTLEDYKQNSDELRRIETESSSLVEDVMIGEAKLTATQKAEFTSKYYESLAKPTIDLKKQHTERIQSLLR